MRKCECGRFGFANLKCLRSILVASQSQGAPGNRSSGIFRYFRPRLHERRRCDQGFVRALLYYRTTILSEETGPNKLHDLKGALDNYQVYAWGKVEELVGLYLRGVDRDRLDPILDACVAAYKADLDEDGQVDFKGKGKASSSDRVLHRTWDKV